MFNPEVTFHHNKLTGLNENCYDGVICLEVVEHISDEELPAFLSGIVRVLKDNKTAFITVPSVNQPLSSKHYKHYTESLLYDLLIQYFRS